MGLLDMFKKKPVTDNSNPELAVFYNDCLEAYHKEASSWGYGPEKAILIPELMPIGEKTVLTFLKDKFFKTQFGNDPHMYYYVIMSLSLQAGLVFAKKWHENYDELKSGYVDRILDDGPADAAKPILRELGIVGNAQENSFYQVIFNKWMSMHEPYWKLKDPRDYTFRATLAAYQLGISMILTKYGY